MQKTISPGIHAAGIVLVFLALFLQPVNTPITETVYATGTKCSITTESMSSVGSNYQVCFSPGGHCSKLLIAELNKAKSSIHVAVYSFTSSSIKDALINAKQRGVNVKVVMDNDQAASKYSQDANLKAAGIEERVDRTSALLHDKYVIIDGSIVITGSYDWSKNAEDTNSENLIAIADTALARSFEQDFAKIWNQAV